MNEPLLRPEAPVATNAVRERADLTVIARLQERRADLGLRRPEADALGALLLWHLTQEGDPSLRRIGGLLGVGPERARQMVASLERKGLLRRLPRSGRASAYDLGPALDALESPRGLRLETYPPRKVGGSPPKLLRGVEGEKLGGAPETQAPRHSDPPRKVGGSRSLPTYLPTSTIARDEEAREGEEMQTQAHAPSFQTESGDETPSFGMVLATPEERELVARLRQTPGWTADDDRDSRLAAEVFRDHPDHRWVIIQASRFRDHQEDERERQAAGRKSAAVWRNLRRAFRDWLTRQERYDREEAERDRERQEEREPEDPRRDPVPGDPGYGRAETPPPAAPKRAAFKRGPEGVSPEFRERMRLEVAAEEEARRRRRGGAA